MYSGRARPGVTCHRLCQWRVYARPGRFFSGFAGPRGRAALGYTPAALAPEILIVGDRSQRGSLIPRVQDLGYTVTPCGDRIQVIPDNIPRELLDRLVRQREGVLALARMAGRGKGQEESFAGLKALLPSLWEPVRLPNGETGVLWGVTARGVLAHAFPTGPVVSYSPEDVQVIE